MRRFGNAGRFLERIGRIRALEPGAAFRSSFILGYPGETEEDHDELLRFIEEAELDWAGFFTFSREEGTLAAGLGEQVPASLALERLQRVLGAAGGDHGASAPGSRRDDLRGARRSAGPRPLVPGSARDRRRRARAGLDPRGVARTGPSRRCRRPRPRCRTGWRARDPGRHGRRDAMKLRDRTFGPSALVTPANALTLARLLASPIMVALVIATGPSSWLLVGLWFVCSSSDGLDGVLARRQGATRSGAFLDPLADKFLVLGVLAALAGIGEIGWLPVILIAAREVSMSVFRSYAGRRGVSVPARNVRKTEDPAAGPRDRSRLPAAGRPAPRSGSSPGRSGSWSRSRSGPDSSTCATRASCSPAPTSTAHDGLGRHAA